MKFAFMSFSCPDLDLSQMIALVKDLGYDALEPRFEAGHHGIELKSDDEKLASARALSLQSEVPYCCVSTSCSFADPADSKKHVQNALRSIEVAAAVGSTRIRVFGGVMPEGLSRPAAIDLVADALSSIADRARDKGVTVCLETHDDWCDPDDVAKLMKKVDHSNIAVNWDIMHPVRVANKSMDEAFEVLQPWIQHVHVHDGVVEPGGNVKLVPIGEGRIDHRRALELLSGMGYEGYISGEWIGWEPPEVHLPRELSILKGIEREIR